MKKHSVARATALAAFTALVLSACSTGADGGAGASGDCEPAGEPVTLTFTSWLPGVEEAVAIWNEENPDIQVEVQTGPNGNSGTYQNFFNQLEAGNAPDLGQIEFDALPNFRVQDGLANIAACEGVADAERPVRRLDLEPGHLRRGGLGLRRPAGHRPGGAVLPRRPVRGGRHRRADHVGGVPRRGRADPCARRLHHQLLAGRRQRLRRTGVAERRPVVRQRRRGLGRHARQPRVDRGGRVLAGPDRGRPRRDLPDLHRRVEQRRQQR